MLTPEQDGRINPLEGEKVRSGVSFGSYFPEKKLTVSDIAAWNIRTAGGFQLDEKAIRSLIGGEARRIAEEGEDTLSMGISAAQQVILGNKRVDFVYFSTSFPRKDPSGKGIDFSDRLGNHLF